MATATALPHATHETSVEDKARAGWTSAADNYAKFAEEFTIQAGEELIKEVDTVLPFSAPSTLVLDDGCGSGVVTAALHAFSPSTKIVAGDIAERMVDILAAKNIPHVVTKTCDALDLSTLGAEGHDCTFSHVLSTFMIQFTEDAHRAVREMHRVVRPQGIVGLATWGKHDLYKLFKRVGQQLDSSWEMPEPYSIQWPTDKEGVRHAFEEIGFVNVKAWMIPIIFNLGMIDYAFSGRNPANEQILRAWRDNGRFYELFDAMKKTAEDENMQHLASEAVMVVGQKK